MKNKIFKAPTLGLILGDTVEKIARKLLKKVKASGYSITMEQFPLLHLLITQGELIQKELADKVGRDKSGVLRQLDIMERNKLIVRKPDTSDRRKKMIVVTKKGAELYSLVVKLDQEFAEELKAGVRCKELETFFSVLMKIREIADR